MLPEYRNAQPDEQNRAAGAVITYWCKPGFVFPDKSNNKQLVCDPHGVWDLYLALTHCARKS